MEFDPNFTEIDWAAEAAAAGSTPTNSSTSVVDLAIEKPELGYLEQLLVPMLWWRALDTQNPNPILNDPYAAGIFERCDFDMSQPCFLRDQRWVTYICNRTRTLDKWCQQFIDAHADSEPVQIIHLGCGLDTRNLRVKWTDRGPDRVRWFDIDLPAVCDLREKVMPSHMGNHSESGYGLRRLSVTDDGWYRDIPADRRTLVVAEAVIFLHAPHKVHNLLHDILGYFGPAGGQLAFDVIGGLLIKHRPQILKKSVMVPGWALDDPRELERRYAPAAGAGGGAGGAGAGLRLTGRHTWVDYLGEQGALGQSAPPIFGPWTSAMLSFREKPNFKTTLQVLRFDFGESAEESAASSEMS